MRLLLLTTLAAIGFAHPTSNSSKGSDATPWIAPASYCNCGLKPDGSFDNWDPAGIWVDIVFIIDNSASMAASLEQAKSMLTSAISLMSTDRSAALHSRIGVIAASDVVEVIYNFNMTSSDNLDAVKPRSAEKADFDAAFDTALDMFFDGLDGHYDNGQQIIYYLSKTAVNPDGEGVRYFKNTDGIIIKLATDNYFFSDLKTGASNLAVLCEANCYCNPAFEEYNDDEKSVRTKANRGCYQAVMPPVSQQEAREWCQTMGSRGYVGALVSIHDQDKEFFVNAVASRFGPKTKYWLGLQNDGKQWNWDDQSTDPFADWDANQPDTNGRQNQCAYAVQTTGLNVKWTTADCSMAGVIAVCETAPCSAGNQDC